MQLNPASGIPVSTSFPDDNIRSAKTSWESGSKFLWDQKDCIDASQEEGINYTREYTEDKTSIIKMKMSHYIYRYGLRKLGILR